MNLGEQRYLAQDTVSQSQNEKIY